MEPRPQRRRHLPGGQGRLRVEQGILHLELLDDDGHHLETRVEVDRSTAHALHHLYALHHATGAPDPTPPTVAMLSTAAAALGGRIDALVVEEGPPPRFRLALRHHDHRLEIPVDLVDAVGLVFSRQVRLEVRAATVDWDGELSRLLEDQH